VSVCLTFETRPIVRHLISEMRRAQQNAPADGINHGTQTAYKQGCRCADCRAESTFRRQTRRRAAIERAYIVDRTSSRWLRLRAHLGTRTLSANLDLDDETDRLVRVSQRRGL